ncbi:hypothetical protein DFQ26_007412 [Actinomortierella ambigua]|nr:hypothetical protein DFQ26_007412 [Actinomortierella ambigua]
MYSTDLASTEPIFSYIDNALEISIFGEYNRIRNDFPPDLCPGLEISDHVYRALQVDNDDMFDSSKICTIVEPLAKAGVSIFYNSTYQTDLLFVPEEKLPVVFKALQQRGIQISQPDEDFERIQDRSYHGLAIHAPDNQVALTPPDTPVSDDQHLSESDKDDGRSISSTFDGSQHQEEKEHEQQGRGYEQHQRTGDDDKDTQTLSFSDNQSSQSTVPWMSMSSLEQSLQQEMACRSVAESLRFERQSVVVVDQHQQQQQGKDSSVSVQSVSTNSVLPSPTTSLSSLEESGEFDPACSSDFAGNGSSSTPYGGGNHNDHHHHLLHRQRHPTLSTTPSHPHAQSLKPLQTARDATEDAFLSRDHKTRFSSSSSSPSSSFSSPTNGIATTTTSTGTASPTTTTAFELRHQAIRTLPENLLRCVGLNTELEMGPPRWMLKVIKILFYEDCVQVPVRRERGRMRGRTFSDSDSDDHEDDDSDEEASSTTTTTIPRFFSFTATADSVSMITDVEILEAEFEEHELFMSLDDQCPLRLIRLDLHRFGLDKVGIVQSVARPLTEAGIELLYLSTFTTANILVLQHRLDDAERILSGTPTPTGYVA